MRLLLRATGFKNAAGVAKVWVHTDGDTWYDEDDAWYVANHQIDESNELNLYVEGVPSGIDGAPHLPPCRLRKRVGPARPPANAASRHTVAVFVLHDKNIDGRMNSILGYPREGVTASNNARGGPFGGPKWDEAKMAVDAEVEPCVIVDMEVWNP